MDDSPNSPYFRALEKAFLERKEREEQIALVTKENWLHHREIKNDSMKSLDNIIFIVSTGAIAISVGTIGYFNGQISIVQSVFLLIAWFSLFLAIVSSGIFYIWNAHASRINMDLLDEFVLSGYTKPKDWNMDTDKNPKITKANLICTFARLFAIAFLLIGALTLFLFGGSLLLSKTNQTDVIKSTHEQAEISKPIRESD